MSHLLLNGDRTEPLGPEPFRAGRFAMLRLAALPAEAQAADFVRRELDLDGAGPGELVAYLLALVSDPIVREAIEVSSGSLAGTIDRVASGERVERAKVLRALLSATRYVLRMSGRPTPFGLLAGIAPVEVAETARSRFGDRHVKRVRPDAGWLHAIVLRLRRVPAVRERLLLTVNNLCEERGDRLVLPYVRQEMPGRGTDRLLSIRCTPVVRSAVEAAVRPIAYAELRTHLTKEFPEAAEADADRLLGQLIDREILLADLTAGWDGADEFGTALGRLAGIDDAQIAALEGIADRLEAYARAPIGRGTTAWRNAVEEMSTVESTGLPPIQVDLRIDADIRVPRTVLDEAARVAGVLWRLSPPGDRWSEIGPYHDEFLERYGVGRPVPVQELLDPHLGLGPPGGYRWPPGERPDPEPPENPYPRERDETLAAALADCRGGELLLDDGLVDRLADGSDEDPPDSLDICIQLYADSAEALNAGDCTLAVAPGAGSQTAGAMCGRFADLLAAETALAGLIASEPDAEPGADPADRPLPAQLFFQPVEPRHGNVSRMPAVLPYRVPVGCFDDVGDPHVLDVREMAIVSDGRRLRVVAAGTGREVAVLRQHMLNLPTSAPNAARFLVALGQAGVRHWAPWQWGRLGVLPSLPRVRYGRTVLCPALWRPDADLADGTLTWPEWQRALGRWRDRRGVPDLVRVGVEDNHLELDLGVRLHQRLFRDHLRRRPDGPVLESTTAYGSTGFTGGRANELVVPLLGPPRRSARKPTPHADSEPVVRTHLPGGEWLYAKVYVHPDLQDTVLVRDVPALVERMADLVDRWFFLRYRDPEAHLRLRFHGPPERLRSEGLAQLRTWADTAVSSGSIRTLVLAPYEPEVERYGGAAALPSAERLFHADSVAVVEQLALRAEGRLTPPIETLAAMNYAEILASLGDWDWRSWVLDAFAVELSNDVPVAERRAALRRIEPDPPTADSPTTGRRAAAAGAYGAAIDVPAGPDRAHIAGVLSVLHLHANRLMGTDREAERRSYGLLRSAVRTHLDERRHRR